MDTSTVNMSVSMILSVTVLCDEPTFGYDDARRVANVFLRELTVTGGWRFMDIQPTAAIGEYTVYYEHQKKSNAPDAGITRIEP